jgi:hypothetical protein
MSNYPDDVSASMPDAPWNKTDETPEMDTGLVRRFAELTARKRKLSSDLDEVKSDLDALQEQILDMMGANGVASLKVDTDEGRFTVFPTRTLWAGALEGDYERACVALKMAGMGDLVEERFNTQRLSAVVREMETTGTPFPESFEGAIKITETFKLGVRKAGKN